MRTIRYQVTLPGQFPTRLMRGTPRDLLFLLLAKGISQSEAFGAALAAYALTDQIPIVVYSRPGFTVTARP